MFKKIYSTFVHGLLTVLNCCNGKVAYDVTHLARKKWLTKRCTLCWKGIGRTPIFGIILKTNEKLNKNWNELLLVCYSETNKFIKAICLRLVHLFGQSKLSTVCQFAKKSALREVPSE